MENPGNALRPTMSEAACTMPSRDLAKHVCWLVLWLPSVQCC